MRSHWAEDANCRGMDTSLFFPQRGDSVPHKKAIENLCFNCPVKEQCLRAGMEQEIQIGYFGGMSARQRRRLVINENKQRRAS